MKYLITGATGLLGGRLCPFLVEKGLDIIRHGMHHQADINVDLTSNTHTREMLDHLKPEVIIHLVCLSSVDTCEEDPQAAYLLNICCLKNIVDWINDHPQTRLVHISTDHVYDGPGLHSEEDMTFTNTYALTKYTSELLVLNLNSIVLRTNFFGKSYTSGRQSLSDWVQARSADGNPFMLIKDVMFNPLSLDTLTELILMVSSSDITGVYNLGSHEGMSKRDFSYEISGKIDLDLSMTYDVNIIDIGLIATRPTGMLMDVTRFEKTFKMKLPTLKEEISKAKL